MGMILLLNALFLLISAMVSFANGMDTAFYPLFLSFLLTSILGAFPLIFVGKIDRLQNKEAYLIVVGAWVVSCMVGMFPYLMWGGEFSFVNAWYESVAGFTATGCTATTNIEALPKGLLFWRASTSWLGGVGVVIFALIVLPSLGKTNTTLSSMERSSLSKDNYRYKVQKMVQILLIVYVGMTFVETILLKIAGMSLFDAVTHSFTTIATCGASTHNENIGHFNNIWIEVIVMVFMVLSSLHFGLIFATISGKHNNIFRSDVTKFFIGSLLLCSAIISVNLWANDVYSTIGESMRYGFFQVISLTTTSAFSTTSANFWPPVSIIILIYLMFQGGCAGSTTAAIKIDRIILAIRSIRTKIRQQQHPNAILRIKLNGVVQDMETVNMVMLFIVLYLLLVVVGTFVVALFGLDLISSFSIAFASLGNIGTAFGDIGLGKNHSELPVFVKLFSTLYMLLGRLEIFGLIQLFFIKWWR